MKQLREYKMQKIASVALLAGVDIPVIKIPHVPLCIPASNPLSFFLKGALKKTASSLCGSLKYKVYWVSP